MAESIDITRNNEGIYDVSVQENGEVTKHSVTISPEIMRAVADGAQVGEIDLEEKVVRLSFEYLLEREPADEIHDSFKLADIERYFPDYRTTIASRI